MVAHPHVRFLADDIWDTPDDGNRYEVIDGRLFVTPLPLVAHQYASGELHTYIGSYLRERPLGIIVSTPIGVRLDDGNGIQPDLVYVANEHRAIITERGIEGVPDLVVEVLSPSTRARDRGIKLRRYAAAGVPHYWIVDPRRRTLEALELGEEGYGRPANYRSGDVFRPALFPGLEIPIDALFI
jgi:Uma2 family endonuclease